MFYRRLLFCGGGIRVIAHVGALEVISDQIQFVKEYCGVSAGALLALCLSIGYSLTELREFVLGFDFTNVMEVDSAPGLLTNFGLDTGNRLQKMTEACIRVKGLSGEITFAELERGLRVYATDLNNGNYITFSKETTPTMRVADAVRASMSFPYYFQPYTDISSGHMYGDGGIISNFPMHTFTERERDETLGFILQEECGEYEEFEFSNFMMRPFLLNMLSRSQSEIRIHGWRSLVIPIAGVNPLNFELDKETKEMLLNQGATAAAKWKLSRHKPTRRFSCS